MIFLYIFIALVILFFGWLFLIAPGDDEKMCKYKKQKYAHRGLHGDLTGDGFAAENSLTAFKRAVENGYGIELDVQLSKDGEVVVFHDSTLDRVTNGEGRVKEKTLDELKQLTLMETEDTVPTLAEVLEVVGGKVPLLVEIKETGINRTVAEKTAETLKKYKGPFIVESFNPLMLAAFKKLMPNVKRGFLLDKLTENEKSRTIIHRATQRCLLNIVARPAFIAPYKNKIKLFPLPLIRALFKTPTFAWTIKSKAEEEDAYRNGFTTVIFEGYLPDHHEDVN